jgi:dihydroorotase-like cyclic amidohydrolase
MLTLIENGQVYSPRPVGRTSVLLVDGKIGRIGRIDHSALESSALKLEVISRRLRGFPGLIDPHGHLR